MKKGVVIADAGPIISLALVNKLEILSELFDEVKIPDAVWLEVTHDENKPFVEKIKEYFRDKVCKIKGFNELTFVMDHGESESVVLYRELNADFLLIDDKKARDIAENLGIKCIGTLGLLSAAKDKKIIPELKPVFEELLQNKRFYAIELLNLILRQKDEEDIAIPF
ncbi:hypothetical protein SDC9_123906 [bioreactor metagenome]|uniref:PIN domain-containing protein n=1 Tax=bioreactor metagenome TaxID=1076179 RepID=A0A645CIX6_9ZZZZ